MCCRVHFNFASLSNSINRNMSVAVSLSLSFNFDEDEVYKSAKKNEKIKKKTKTTNNFQSRKILGIKSVLELWRWIFLQFSHRFFRLHISDNGWLHVWNPSSFRQIGIGNYCQRAQCASVCTPGKKRANSLIGDVDGFAFSALKRLQFVSLDFIKRCQIKIWFVN